MQGIFKSLSSFFIGNFSSDARILPILLHKPYKLMCQLLNTSQTSNKKNYLVSYRCSTNHIHCNVSLYKDCCIPCWIIYKCKWSNTTQRYLAIYYKKYIKHKEIHQRTDQNQPGGKQAKTKLISIYQPEVLHPMLLQEPFSNLLSPTQVFEIELLSLKTYETPLISRKM